MKLKLAFVIVGFLLTMYWATSAAYSMAEGDTLWTVGYIFLTFISLHLAMGDLRELQEYERRERGDRGDGEA